MCNAGTTDSPQLLCHQAAVITGSVKLISHEIVASLQTLHPSAQVRIEVLSNLSCAVPEAMQQANEAA